MEGTYSNNERAGVWKEYYSNGQQAEETFYLQQKQLVYQHWDEAGNEMLTNGTGMCNHTDLDGVEWHGEVVDSVITIFYYIDMATGDSIYTVTEENASYKGGMDDFYNEVEDNLKYPKLARQFRIEGKVFIQFIIDKSGVLCDAKVLKGIVPANLLPSNLPIFPP